MPQLRHNIITGEWVVIALERAQRPQGSPSHIPEVRNPVIQSSCPFCVHGASYPTRIRTYESNILYVIPNKYPTFIDNKNVCISHKTNSLDIFAPLPSVGGHDVVILKNHNSDIYTFTPGIWLDLFTMSKRRYAYWKDDCNCEYAMMIYNHGERAGASLAHPHAQILASNIIPNRIERELDGARRYSNLHRSCVFCDLLENEQRQKIRMVAETDLFCAFTFYAPRFPYEVWVLPKHHLSQFESEGRRTITELAQIMHDVIGKIGKTCDAPPLNFFIHDSPTKVGETQHYHWHIEITPRLSHYGGYEIGSDVIIDIDSPEKSAAELIR